MRNHSKRASLPDRPKTPSRKLGLAAMLVALLLLLAACRTAPPEPAPRTEPELDMELELALLDLPVNEEFRVRFLPPLVRAMPAGEFVGDLALEIWLFNVNPDTGMASGATLGSTLSTLGGTIRSQRGEFSTIWHSASMLSEPRASEYLRAEIRLPGGPDAPVCNEQSEHCLGYLDIYMSKGSGRGNNKAPTGFVPVPAGALPINFKVLEEQAPPADQPPPATVNELMGVTGVMLQAGGSAPNCVSPFSARPGQGLQRVGAGLQRVGAVGGLLEVDTSEFTGSLTPAEQVGQELLEREMFVDNLQRSAVVLIVDDFTAGYELPEGIFTSGAPISDYAGQISHGALVLHQLREMGEGLLTRFGSGWQEGVGPDGQPYWAWGSGGKKLYLQAVNVGQDSTDVIPPAVLEAISFWSHRHVKDFVVNMSFAIVPCSVAEDYDGASKMAELGIDTFEKYLAALADVNGIGQSYLSELDALVSLPPEVEQDPLLLFIDCPVVAAGVRCDGSPESEGTYGYHPYPSFYTLYFVASSGNYGNGYALYPAAAPTVVSVGALEYTSGGFAVSSYSNAAEIGAPGGLFLLNTANGQTVAYTGTSFAAPAVSLFLAYDTMNSPTRCDTPDVAGHQPPLLASGAYVTLPFYTLDGSGSALDVCLGHD